MTRAVDLANSVANGVSLGFKNRIINGAMQIWQRGTSLGSVSNSYIADRWACQNQTSAAQSADVPSSAFPYSLEVTNTSASYPLALQRIEAANCLDLIGQQVTLSFWAKNVSGANAWLYVELYYPSAKDNFGSITLIQAIVLSQTPSTSWTYYTATFNALPSNISNGLEVRLVRNNGSASTTRYTGVQLEVGSTATNFEYRDYGRELIMCQRYYEKTYDQSVAVGTVNSGGSLYETAMSSDNNGNAITRISFSVTKRAAPTISSWSYAGTSGKWQYWRSGVGLTEQTFQTAYIGTSGFGGYVAVGVGWVVATIRGHWAAEAEL